MPESFVIALREGVEGALVVCLLLAYLRKTGREGLRRAVYAGLAAACVASVGVAALLASLGVAPENEAVEGTLLLVSALFVVSMVVWMWIHGKGLKKRIERRVDTLAPGEPGAAARIGVFLFTFLMVGREGVELVLLLGATTFGTQAVLALAGGLLGLAVAVGLGVAFLRGSLRVDLRKFFAVTTVMLLVFAAELLAGAFHEFVEAGVLQPGDPERYMRIVGPLVRNRVLFAAAMVLLPFALLAWKRRAGPPSPAANPAERRKEIALARRERAWRLGFSGLSALALFALGASAAGSARGLELSPAIPLAPEGSRVRVPLEGLEGGRLYRYSVDVGDRDVRFLVMKEGSGPRVALDACRICSDWGYVQQGDRIVCRNCVAEIVPQTIGQAGGCNPIPLGFQVEAGSVVVEMEDIEEGKEWFRAAPTPVLECPFCRMRFRPEDGGPSFEFEGRTRRACRMPECAEKASAPGGHLR